MLILVFTLPDAETNTEPEPDTDTNTFTQNPMGICVGFCLCAGRNPPHSSIQPIFINLCSGLCVGQCEHTIGVRHITNFLAVKERFSRIFSCRKLKIIYGRISICIPSFLFRFQ